MIFIFLQPTLEKAQLHALHGDQLIQSNHYAVDSIRPKCVELRRVCDDFSNEAKKKTDVLSKSLKIRQGIDKVRMRYESGTFTHVLLWDPPSRSQRSPKIEAKSASPRQRMRSSSGKFSKTDFLTSLNLFGLFPACR